MPVLHAAEEGKAGAAVKVIIAGSRGFKLSVNEIDAVVARADIEPEEVVCGCARGIDTSGANWAEVHGVTVTHFEANWRTDGLAAGPRRNQAMVDYADAMILIWDGKSRGSADVLRRAKAKGIPVYEEVVG